MGHESESRSQDVINRLTGKLQAFIDALPEDEAHAMGTLLQQASTEHEADVYGCGSFGAELLVSGLSTRGIIIVGGHGSQPPVTRPPSLGTREGIIIVGGRGR
jgi:hypothetical protein